VKPEYVDRWRVEGQAQVIGQAELLPIALALCTWPHLFEDANALFFVDNSSAIDCVVHGISDHHVSLEFAKFFRHKSVELRCGSWLERVPSRGNVADWPSRGELNLMQSMGAARRSFVVDERLKDLLPSLTSKTNVLRDVWDRAMVSVRLCVSRR